jgi:hypothetical protein
MEGVDPEVWLNTPGNIMYDVSGSIGLLTFEYNGVRTVHWFFKVRGRAAINLAREMLDDAFTNHGLKLARGITPKGLPAARWGARQVGMTSQGFMDFPRKGLCEVFTLTKEDFYKGQK